MAKGGTHPVGLLPVFRREQDVPLPLGWSVTRIQDLYDQLPTGAKREIRTCKAAGNIPVLDQSKEGFLGFHDDDPGVAASPSDPVVTFANHTCAMRFVTQPFSVIQNVFPMKGKAGICDTRFLFFCTDRRFTITDYKGHHPEWRSSFVPVPPLPTQRKIASILSAYDDLIENNNRRIKLLEEMAQRIYREWFVEFKYPGHEDVPLGASELGAIPQGWSTQPLFDVAEITFGFPFKSELFNTDAGLPVIRIRDIPTGESATLTTEEPGAAYRVSDGDILVGMDGEFHMGRWSAGDAWLNQRVARFRVASDAICRYALFLALEKPIADWNQAIVGTTVAHLGKRHLELIRIPRPPRLLTSALSAVLDPVFDLEICLRKAARQLRATRDLLLPRLVSGEIDVTGLDIAVSDLAA